MPAGAPAASLRAPSGEGTAGPGSRAPAGSPAPQPVILANKPLGRTVSSAAYLSSESHFLTESPGHSLCICADSRDALRAGLAGLLLNHTGRATDRMGYKCDIEPLDILDGGPTTLIRIDGHGGPAPLEPAAGVSRPLHVLGPGWDRWSLYYRWTEQHGLRHCTEWGRWTDTGWSR
jgi:hypothetical protein